MNQAPAVLLRTTTANDVTLAVVGGLLASLFLGGVLGGLWHAQPSDLEGSRYAELVSLVLNVFGPLGLVIPAGFLGCYFACLGGGAVWRLIDRRPAVVADEAGLQFHPSVYPGRVAWADLAAVRVAGSPGQLEFVIKRRFWSTSAWLTSRKVALKLVALRLSWREARELARLLGEKR